MKQGWQIKKLGDIFQIQRGGSPRPISSFLTNDADGINWIKIGDTKNVTKYIYKTREKIKPEGLEKTRLVHDGDFILSNSMSFGRPYIMKTTGAIHDGWLVLREKLADIDKDFFYYLLSSPVVFNQFDELAAGSTVRNLNTKLVSNVSVLFPPITEQQRIVKILDEVFENIAKTTENVEKNLQNTRELFDSYSSSMYENLLNQNVSVTLKEVSTLVRGPFGGSLTKTMFVNDGYAVYEQRNAINQINDNFRYFIDVEKYKEMERFAVKGGDLLMSCSGTIGKFTILEREPINGIINQALLKITPNIDKITAEYLLFILGNFIKNGSKLSKGAAIKNIVAVKELKKIRIPMCSLKDQVSIILDLNQFSMKTNKLIKTYQQKLNDLEELKKSILQQAFTGKL
jgi:type I restriction enzyme, S subunit